MIRKTRNLCRKNKNLIIFLLIFSIIFIGFTIRYRYKFNTYYAVSREFYADDVAEENNLGRIENNTIIRQEVITEIDEITDIKLQIFTYQKVNKGVIGVKLYDYESKKILFQSDLLMSELIDGAMQSICLNKTISDVKGKKLVLELSVLYSNVSDDITFQATKGNTMGFSKLHINDIEQPLDLKMILHGKSSDFFERFAFMIDTILISIFISLLYFVFSGKHHIKK